MFKRVCRTVLSVGLISVLMTCIFATSTYAETSCAGASTTIIECSDNSNGVWPIISMVVSFLSLSIGLFATIAIIAFGVRYMMARDNEEKMKMAKKRMVEIALGLAAYGILYSVVNLIIPGGLDVDSVKVSSVSVSTESVTMQVGEMKQMFASISPAEAETFFRVNWTSSDESIVSITSNGMASALKAGTVTLTASAGEGKEAKVKVTVQPKQTAEKASSPTTSGEGQKPIGKVSDDSTSVACATGTVDLGINDNAYLNGKRISVRLCEVPNIECTSTKSFSSNGHIVVNSRVSGAYYALGERYKSQHSGSRLRATESFRTNERQEYFYHCYKTGSCNNGNNAARPGYSDHQLGLAVDFDSIGGWNTTASQWFYSNLSDFGMSRPVSSEYWHVAPQKSYF